MNVYVRCIHPRPREELYLFLDLTLFWHEVIDEVTLKTVAAS